MTERRDPQHGRPPARSSRDDAGRETDGALADLQRQAGNKAVADLLGRSGTPVPQDPASSGIRVRDALRAGRTPVQREFALGLQRDVLKEQIKALTRLLRRGDRGSDVETVQRLLGVTADGIFGRATRTAVIAFQRQNGLVPDGIVGPLTFGALSSSPLVLGKGAGVTDKAIAASTGKIATDVTDKAAGANATDQAVADSTAKLTPSSTDKMSPGESAEKLASQSTEKLASASTDKIPDSTLKEG